jgi:hypothetical protein
MIETFADDWQKQWYNYRDGWARSTHKVYEPQWQAPADAKLMLQVASAEANKLVVKIDDSAAEVPLVGGSAWEVVELSAADFKNSDGQPLQDFQDIKELRLSPQETLRGKNKSPVSFGGAWRGADPVFNNLHWSAGQPTTR